MRRKAEMFYIHTIDGKPGYFDGDQIVKAERADHWKDDYPTVTAVQSEDQILDERARSERFRLRHKWDVPHYDYIIVTIGESVVIPWDTKHYRPRRNAAMTTRKEETFTDVHRVTLEMAARVEPSTISKAIIAALSCIARQQDQIARLKARKPFVCGMCGEKFKTAKKYDEHRNLAGHGGQQ